MTKDFGAGEISVLEKNADISALPEVGAVIIGFSGGADSMALTHYIASRLDKSRIICAHLNHMLRGEAALLDERAVEDFCKEHGLRFEVRRIDVQAEAKKRGIGTEECGRELRYDFFEELVSSAEDKILTAHNANDNAETMLMNMVRGSSLSGLTGIPYVRGRVVRPLIKVSRGDIEDYCKLFDLPYVTDATNSENEYTRNKLRNLVLPVLEEINPRVVESFSALSASLLEDREYLDSEAQKLLDLAREPHGLNVSVLKAAPVSLLKRALKLYLEEQGSGRLEKKHIDVLSSSLANGSSVSIPGKLNAAVSGGYFRVAPEVEKLADEPWSVEIAEEKTFLPDGRVLTITLRSLDGEDIDTENRIFVHKKLFSLAFDYDTITKALCVRNRREGDSFSPAGRNVTKKLKKLFNELGIPQHVRGNVGIIESGGEIVFVEGVGPAEKFKLTEDTKTAAIVEIH